MKAADYGEDFGMWYAGGQEVQVDRGSRVGA
jgi:hypothetical protein